MSWYLDAESRQCKPCQGRACDDCEQQWQQFSAEPALMVKCGWVNIDASILPSELSKYQQAIKLITPSGGTKGYSSQIECEKMRMAIGSQSLPNEQPRDPKCQGGDGWGDGYCPCFLQNPNSSPDPMKPSTIVNGLCGPIGVGNYCVSGTDCLSGICENSECGSKIPD